MNCLFLLVSLSMMVTFSYHTARLVSSLRLASNRLFYSTANQVALLNETLYQSAGVKSTAIEKWLSNDFIVLKKFRLKSGVSGYSKSCELSRGWNSVRCQRQVRILHV